MSRSYLTAARLTALDAQLSGRDQAIVRRVSELRFVTGSQLVRLHFASVPARTAREALLRLTRLNVLTRLPRPVGGVRAGSAGFVYRLGSAGQRLAVMHGWQLPKRHNQAQVPGTLFVAHALMVAELHTRLIEADRQGHIELIELAGEPGCHRQYAGLGGQRVLKPDSFVRFALGDYEWSYFIEVDRGTEGSRALLAKLRQYALYQARGQEQARRGVFPKVLWLVPDTPRQGVIQACIEQLAPASRELFLARPFAALLTTLIGPDGAAESLAKQLPASVD